MMNPATWHRLVFLSACLFGAGAATAQPLFTDVTEEIGVSLSYATRSNAFGDYDNDGWPDLFIAESGGAARFALLHNDGDGSFSDQTMALQADSADHLKGGGSMFGDYDNDGDLDLLVTLGGGLGTGHRNVLLRNDRGVFADVTLEAGLTDMLSTDNAVWLDYDRDGYLDLYTGNAAALPADSTSRNKLYRNQGDGRFADLTEAAGLNLQLHPDWGGTLGGMAAADFNDDGWPDLYMGNFLAPNRLFLSDGQGGFSDATTAEIGDADEAFAVVVGDIDNDGDLDIFQTAGGSGGGSRFRSLILLNLGQGQFQGVTETLGLASLGATQLGIPGLADIDNDGDLDLLISDLENFSQQLFLNNGEGFFVKDSALLGLDPWVQLSLGDYNGDGFLDILSSGFNLGMLQTSFYYNTANNNHWLRVELVGVQSNRNGIGARLFATTGELRQMREVLGGNGRTQDEQLVHFGLGQRAQVDQLEIRWPSGQVDVLTDVPADQKVRIIEGQEAYHIIQPTRWERRPPAVLVAGVTTVLTAAVWPAPFATEAAITRVTADLSAVGGPAEVPLVAAEDGLYQLESVFEVDHTSGLKQISIQVEQSTSLGPYWTGLSRPIAIWPAEDRVVFADAGVENWSLETQFLLNLTNQPTSDGGSPTWSPDGSKIAFISDRDGNFEIYTMDADGTNLVRLTDHPAFDAFPSWSPDGSKIAFISDRDDNDEIYVMSADGTNPVNLTNNGEVDDLPSWSPDGAKIAFYSHRDGNNEIYVMAADGSDPVNLSNNPANDREPSWSPDGTQLVFSSDRDGNPEIFVMSADGSEPVNLTNHAAVDAAFPSWSPDGSKIAFGSNRDGNFELYTMGADGSDPLRLTNHPAPDIEPSWSADGTQLVFRSDREGNPEVFVLETAVHLVELDPDQRTVVHQGQSALKLQTDGPWSVGYVPAAPLDIVGYEALRFAFHPGDIVPLDNDALWVSIGQSVNLLDGPVQGSGVDLAQQEWQVVEIPLALFDLQGPIESVRFGGDLSATFYLDDVRLTTSAAQLATAVEEGEAAVLPTAFALEQNYPNPFNGGTLIRFALPRAQEVELAVYNLLGQKVATLVEGQGQVGRHVVSWDGRDERGHTLASGLYLYRLRAGTEEIATRKLILLR